MQAVPIAAAVVSVAIAGIAIVADRRSLSRQDLSRGSYVPWPQVMFTALIAALIFVILAVKGG